MQEGNTGRFAIVSEGPDPLPVSELLAHPERRAGDRNYRLLRAFGLAVAYAGPAACLWLVVTFVRPESFLWLAALAAVLGVAGLAVWLPRVMVFRYLRLAPGARDRFEQWLVDSIGAELDSRVGPWETRLEKVPHLADRSSFTMGVRPVGLASEVLDDLEWIRTVQDSMGPSRPAFWAAALFVRDDRIHLLWAWPELSADEAEAIRRNHASLLRLRQHPPRW